MASQDLRQRIKDEPTTTSTSTTNKTRKGGGTKMDMAKKGLRSLAIAIFVPVSLTIIVLYLSGSNHNYKALPKPFWFPPLWALNFFCVASSFFMGLSSWLVWAEGGFHKQPAALPLCLAQLGLSLAWKPVVFMMSGTWLGLTICVAMFGTLVGCSRIFRDVNPIAGDLVKPCLVWVAFLTIINYKLIYL